MTFPFARKSPTSESRPLPPIDLGIPGKLATATFAVG